MPKNYVLVDYENVQPTVFSQFDLPEFHVRVFIGAAQKTLATAVAKALQPLGRNAEYVQVTGIGNNALDFHIAFYMGLHANEPDVSFYIVSKDKGYDPLIKHLKNIGHFAKRVVDLNSIPVLKSFSENSVDGKVERIVTNLSSRGKSVPKKETTLRNSINALFGKNLSDGELTSIVGRMKNLGHIEINNSKITYNPRQ
ncbi:MAG: PIN domain-containing protein [Paracoccaceae bacterium]